MTTSPSNVVILRRERNRLAPNTAYEWWYYGMVTLALEIAEFLEEYESDGN